MTRVLILATAAILAQSITDPISGNTGWVGAGLLGGVLGWLLFVHLPNKDKQIKDLVAEHNGTVKEVADAHAAALKEVTATFKEETKAERVSCETHFSRLADAMSRSNDAIMQSFAAINQQVQNHAERNRQWVELLQKEINSRLAMTNVAQAALEKGKQ